VVALAVGAGCTGPPAGAATGPPARGPDAPATARQPSVPPSSERSSEPPPAITFPDRGDGQWSIAPGDSAIAGTGGRLLSFRVAVERGIANLDVAQFAGTVFDTLADPRGWTADRRWRLRRVGSTGPYDFTIYLATPGTRDQMCAGAPDGYTSCRNGDRVVINVARWARGVPNYGAGLDVYRQYVVNHEVGHRLGHGHETCPTAGRPAPVMQQQTLGLHNCTANPWPFVDGRAYSGPSGTYDDPVPRN